MYLYTSRIREVKVIAIINHVLAILFVVLKKKKKKTLLE